MLDTSDLADAKKFVATQPSHAGAHASSYRGVAYQATSGGDAFAVIDKLVVLGTESGVHAVIDTTQGGSSLKGNATYAQLQSVAPAGALGHVYANPAALTQGPTSPARPEAKPSQQSLPALLSVLGGTRPLNVSLVPCVEARSRSTPTSVRAASGRPQARRAGGLVAAAAAGNRALGELPGRIVAGRRPGQRRRGARQRPWADCTACSRWRARWAPPARAKARRRPRRRRRSA